MQKRPIGTSALHVAPLCFGGNVFGWTIDEKQSFQLLDAFIDQGFNFIDTADTYSRWVPGHIGGESETILGKWLKQRGGRENVIIATKVGGDMGHGKKDLSADYILQEVETSLRRLQTDYIDLYQSHYDDPDTSPEETLSAYDRLIREGKVRVIGASNLSADRIRLSLQISREHGYPLYQSLQPLYNLYDRQPFENELLDLCRENTISVLSYYSLASGFLTGKYRSEADFSKSARGGGMKKYLNARGYRILEVLDTVAKRYETSLAGVSIAWLLSQPQVAAPIASATSIRQLKELVAGATLKLDPDALALLNTASS
jgi:aryl-alcohol dehydrogenase-like predicted oxidoreductase